MCNCLSIKRKNQTNKNKNNALTYSSRTNPNLGFVNKNNLYFTTTKSKYLIDIGIWYWTLSG